MSLHFLLDHQKQLNFYQIPAESYRISLHCLRTWFLNPSPSFIFFISSFSVLLIYQCTSQHFVLSIIIKGHPNAWGSHLRRFRLMQPYPHIFRTHGTQVTIEQPHHCTRACPLLPLIVRPKEKHCTNAQVSITNYIHTASCCWLWTRTVFYLANHM